MSQAEIAGGAVTPAGELPSKGHRLRDFELTSTRGDKVRLSDYRGHANLVIAVADTRGETAELLSQLDSRYPQIRAEDAEVLLIAPPDATELPEHRFPILVDGDGRMHRELGAEINPPQAAVYVADRFGEVYGAYRTADGHPLPSVGEVLNWLEFINRQCPECEPPEWPL